MTTCIEVEKLARILAKNAGLPPPDLHLAEFAEKPVVYDPDVYYPDPVPVIYDSESAAN